MPPPRHQGAGVRAVRGVRRLNKQRVTEPKENEIEHYPQGWLRRRRLRFRAWR
jgi:hypothetical protein